MLAGAVVLFCLMLAFVAMLLNRRRRQWRRAENLRTLLNLVDRIEADLKSCRTRLRQAHAVMALNADLPAASEESARQAVDAGLRAVLQQRLWIRDRAAHASEKELQQATRSMHDTRERLRPLLDSLSQVQRDLDSAIRGQIQRESRA